MFSQLGTESPPPSTATSDNLVQKKRRPGRPRTLDMEGASSSAGSAPTTPAAQMDLDPLAQDEYAAFGVNPAEESLPLPPNASVGNAGVGSLSKRTLDAALPAAPLGRAKRPKNVKFSPAKSGKALVRRSVAGPGQLGDADSGLPNNDFCDACSGKGHFLCCEGGCLRSFHFTCLEPPLELDDVPDEAWFCKACLAAQEPPPKPARGFFRELIHRVNCENPKAFVLPPEIKNFFKNVATGPTGDFIDSTEHRPPSKITGRAIGQEDRDGYRLKDKLGHTILCYKCSSSASLPKHRRIISCDFCEQHWHLDCLDPPMTGMPPPTRKWMCPVHAELTLPKKRQPKQTQTIVVRELEYPNNGDVTVIPRVEAPRVEEFDELTVNRVRYQVPEETIILDFWGRVGAKSSRKGKKRSRQHQLAASGSRESSPGSGGSSLTSLGEMSDADPPDGALGYSPYAGLARPDAPPPLNTSALDDLALLADEIYTEMNGEKDAVAAAAAQVIAAEEAARRAEILEKERLEKEAATAQRRLERVEKQREKDEDKAAKAQEAQDAINAKRAADIIARERKRELKEVQRLEKIAAAGVAAAAAAEAAIAAAAVAAAVAAASPAVVPPPIADASPRPSSNGLVIKLPARNGGAPASSAKEEESAEDRSREKGKGKSVLDDHKDSLFIPNRTFPFVPLSPRPDSPSPAPGSAFLSSIPAIPPFRARPPSVASPVPATSTPSVASPIPATSALTPAVVLPAPTSEPATTQPAPLPPPDVDSVMEDVQMLP